MKIIIKTLLIIAALSFSSAYAEIYKCGILDVIVAYQEEPCKTSGLDGRKFRLNADISAKQYQAASKKLAAELKVYKKNKALAKQDAYRERLVSAEETKAYALLLDAAAHERRVDLIENNNFSSRLRHIYKSDRLVRLVPVSDSYLGY